MTTENTPVSVRHNPGASRFEARVAGQVAVLDYILKGDRILFTHTGVPPELEGRGIGSALARAGLEHARAAGLQVVPLCSFVATYIKRHPEEAELGASR